MPKTSIADRINDWENLISTVKTSAAEAPGLDVHISPLETLLADAKALTARFETTKGIKQQISQERRELLARGQDLASRARAALKAHFGLRSERMVEFGSRPIRARKRKLPQPTDPTGTETPTPPTPTPEVRTAENGDQTAPPATTR